jgi:amidase
MDFILSNARRVGAEDALTDTGIADGRIAAIEPKLATPSAELEAYRARAFGLLSIAGLAQLPQLTLPLGTVVGCPFGLSLIAARGHNCGILNWTAAAEIS